MSKKEERIFERNPDTGQIRSRKKGDYGNESIIKTSKVMKEQSKELIQSMDKVVHPLRNLVREEVLDELWAANKVNHKGHWYVRMSDIVKIIRGKI